MIYYNGYQLLRTLSSRAVLTALLAQVLVYSIVYYFHRLFGLPLALRVGISEQWAHPFHEGY